MTKEEAIEILQRMSPLSSALMPSPQQAIDAVNMAIAALSIELPQEHNNAAEEYCKKMNYLNGGRMNKAEEALKKAYPGDAYYYIGSIGGRLFKEGYEQAEKDTIERACKWLESLAVGDMIVDVKAFVGAFRNEMEE